MAPGASSMLVRAARRALASSAATGGGAWRVCIVGSGPAGFYTADALLKGSPDVRVDILDRLPVPFGLVRYGVAPDHPEVKNVTERFTGIARDARVRFAGNVRVADGAGLTVSVDELRARYDAVVLACGADGDRALRLPGEGLRGVSSAREFVAWYSGHPDCARAGWDLSRHDTAIVIGQGNVALDVARVLTKRPAELASTDIASEALAALERSAIRRVIVTGRRGPLQAAFTTKELRELSKLDGVRLSVLLGCNADAGSHGTADDEGGALSERALAALSGEADRPRRRQAELLRKLWLESVGGGGVARQFEREIVLAFHMQPVGFEPAGVDAGARAGNGGEVAGELGAVRFERTQLSPDGRSAVGTGEYERTPCGYAFRSIGYLPSALPGVPFDARRSLVPSAHGRVLGSADAAAMPLPGLYCSGWYKRGPSGVVLSNIGDGAETAAAILADRAAGTLGARAGTDGAARGGLDAEGDGSLRALLAGRGVRPVDFAGWERIDRHEREAGAASGKRLRKVVAVEDMLRLAREADD
ncbi:hypothetical protein KFE25_010856 [Diacronema lutheri]|uniref:NADPH:adrenodoxin oxidoreductase, mitochondrial n=1 Tax=Diacronema lutheri TaxID=2081491 RepID=A0A8J5X8M3_DIALT|nr:hypothetical protein KFE25_010856 [Diacronema lutheri]